MVNFLLKRILLSLGTLVAASIVVFVVLDLLPGDAAQVLMGIEATKEAVEALREQMGLNGHPVARYFSWIGGLLSGDMGQSFTYQTGVAELVLVRMQVTGPIALMAMTLTVLFAIPVAITAAAHHNRPRDYLLMTFSQLGIAVPSFWFAILLVMLFAVKLGWLPAGGFPGWENGFWPALRALLLPSLALAFVQAAVLARFTRSAILDVYREDFVRTARAKGLTQRQTLWRHVLRNAMLSVTTVLGLEFASLLAGTIIIEQVFFLPGLGRLVFQAVSQRDLVVVKNVVILITILVICINILIDVIYVLIDPRMRARNS